MASRVARQENVSLASFPPIFIGMECQRDPSSLHLGSLALCFHVSADSAAKPA